MAVDWGLTGYDRLFFVDLGLKGVCNVALPMMISAAPGYSLDLPSPRRSTKSSTPLTSFNADQMVSPRQILSLRISRDFEDEGVIRPLPVRSAFRILNGSTPFALYRPLLSMGE
ncbi:hypothetical protein [Rhizobium sp. L1K21]|uniref:hypothetical protein n=1 Tax=Rhizobium sp. L1K21 TaxID=2954933 RepID=UPI0035945CE0